MLVSDLPFTHAKPGVMDQFVSEISFSSNADLAKAIDNYNSKAAIFGAGLAAIEAKYAAYLAAENITMGVETVEYIDNCIIKLKALPDLLAPEIQAEIIALFNTTWSQ